MTSWRPWTSRDVPTYARTRRFQRDHARLSADDKRSFRQAVDNFVNDLRGGGSVRPGLRIKRVQGTQGIFEMTWAPDGRATFEYGLPEIEGEPHVIWRR